MKKRVLSILLTLIMVMCLFSGLTVTVSAAVTEWDGSTKTEPTKVGEVYQIDDGEELSWFAAQVNSGSANISASLTADICLNNASAALTNVWTPIGTADRIYTGSFNGNGHTVVGLYINGGDGCDIQGLFGAVGGGAKISNVAVTGSINAADDLGGIVGMVCGGTAVIDNCLSSVAITKSTDADDYGAYNAGGIVGEVRNYGSASDLGVAMITDCIFNSTISGSFTSYGYPSEDGGIIGYSDENHVYCDNCYYLQGSYNSDFAAGIALSADVLNTYAGEWSSRLSCAHTGDTGTSSSAKVCPTCHKSYERNAQTPLFLTNLSTDAVVYDVDDSVDTLAVSAAVADGGSVSYQWYSSADGTNYTEITGETSSGYAPSTASVGTVYYKCAATNTKSNANGNTVEEAMSAVATVNVAKGGTMITAYVTVSYEGEVLTNGATGKALYAASALVPSGSKAESAFVKAVKDAGYSYEKVSGYGVSSAKDFTTYNSIYGGVTSSYIGCYSGCANSLGSEVFVNGKAASSGELSGAVANGDRIDVVLYDYGTDYSGKPADYLYFSSSGSYNAAESVTVGSSITSAVFESTYADYSWGTGSAASGATIKFYTRSSAGVFTQTSAPFASVGTIYAVASKAGCAPAVEVVTVSASSDAPSAQYAYLTVYGPNSVLLSQKAIAYTSGLTAYSLLLNYSGLSVESNSKNTYGTYYVSAISGYTEQAKEYGDMSGWMYSVNGETPNKGASAYSLSAGDSVLWFYTKDGKTAMYSPYSGGTATQQTVFTADSTGAVAFTADKLSDIIAAGKGFSIDAVAGDVALTEEGAEALSEKLGASEELKVEVIKTDAAASKFVVVSNSKTIAALDVSIKAGGTEIKSGFGTMTISVAVGEAYKNQTLAILHLKDDGSYEILTGSVDTKGLLSFNTASLSTFVVISAADIPVEYRYADVKAGEWYVQYVQYTWEKGLMAGTADTAFEPKTVMFRAMLVTVLYRMAGSPELTGTSKFKDVSDSTSWYYNAVIWASKNGIVNGYGDGSFGANDNITREQLVTIFYRYAKYKGYDVSAGDDTNILSYDDSLQISEWAYPGLQWALGAGIINGTGTDELSPSGSATRCEAAAVITRFMKSIKA